MENKEEDQILYPWLGGWSIILWYPLTGGWCCLIKIHPEQDPPEALHSWDKPQVGILAGELVTETPKNQDPSPSPLGAHSPPELFLFSSKARRNCNVLNKIRGYICIYTATM